MFLLSVRYNFLLEYLVRGNTNFVNEAGCYTFGFKRQLSLSLQLQPYSLFSDLFLITFLLCLLMILNMLSMQLQLTFMLFLLKISWNLRCLRECFPLVSRKPFPQFFLSHSCCSYGYCMKVSLVLSKTSLLQDKCEIILLIFDHMSMII